MAKEIADLAPGERKLFDSQVVVPRYYEFESFKRKANLKIYLGYLFFAVVTLSALVLAGIAFVRELPVVEVVEGKAYLRGDTTKEEIHDLDINKFTTEFLELYEGVDSASMMKNYTKALDMMTPEFYELSIRNKEDISNRKIFESKNLLSKFEDMRIKIGSYDPLKKNQTIFVYVTGVMEFLPRFGELELKPGQEVPRKWFLSELVIKRVRRTEKYYWGLAAKFLQTWRFNSLEEYEKHIISRANVR